jgi:chromosome segregation ATPase
MLQQLQQQREQGTQQEAQLQRQQEQARQQAVQLQKQQDDIARLRQQHTQELAASKAEAAELRGRVQALEGQLQEVLAALRQQQRDP